MESLLYGREVLLQEIPVEDRGILEKETVKKVSGLIKKKREWVCRRCNQVITIEQGSPCTCGKECMYCVSCIQMGKVKRCSVLYSIPEPNLFSVEEPIMAWKGKLSPQQSEASNEIIHSIKKKETHLIWAVAGAGKTEMLFKGIEEAIRRQYRICIASPRVDVCLELAPRIQAAFPRVSLAVLYGEMEVAYTYTQIVVATTHQLYRFKEAFDVMIIDEVDAFPFHLDEALQFSVEKAKKKQSAVLYLTATPDRKTQRKVTQKMLKATILPARYHRHPLPEPTYKWCVNWRRNLIKDPQQTPVVKEMIQLLEQEKRFLVFVPSVEWMHQIEKNFRNIFEKASFECVHSSDPDRKEKVQKMRDQTVDFLITTTILERGVTFPNIDVLVIGAEEKVFTESALVQIAGRAGRSPEFPTGNVLFFHDGVSKEMKRAVKQIKKMNKVALERGVID